LKLGDERSRGVKIAKEYRMVTTVSRAELLKMLEDDATQLVDVLPQREFLEGHLPGAINLPLKKLNRETATALDPARPVALY
jgi:rhodanese-related sulfurtransferase